MSNISLDFIFYCSISRTLYHVVIVIFTWQKHVCILFMNQFVLLIVTVTGVCGLFLTLSHFLSLFYLLFFY